MHIVYMRCLFYEVIMVTRKENTPQRLANRKYEEKNKEKRKATSGNFQTMIPRELLEKINAFLKEYRLYQSRAYTGGL